MKGRYDYQFGQYIPDFRIHPGYRASDQMRSQLRGYSTTEEALRDLALSAPGVIKFVQAYSMNLSTRVLEADVHVVNEDTVTTPTKNAYADWLKKTGKKIDDDIFQHLANPSNSGAAGGSGIVNFTIGPGGGGGSGGGGYVTHVAGGPNSVTVFGADPSTEVSRTVSLIHFDKALAEMKQEIIQQVCDELQTILAPLLKGQR